jgi:hypothetical protein
VTYQLRFLPAAEAEFLRLPRKLQVELKELRPYLEANSYRAYPFLPVKEVGKVPGVWRFPLGPIESSTRWMGSRSG